jgi:predicted lipoprotein with Yx(FWY)xxD motif
MKQAKLRTAGLLGLVLGTLLSMSLAVTPQSFAQSPSVRVADNDTFGPILTDSNGMTLYTYIPDDGSGLSKCVDACATSWPPATIQGDVTAPSGLPKKLDVTTRADGSKQLMYDNWPLYRYARDTEPGQTGGDGSLGAGGLWPIAQTGAVTPTVMFAKNPRLGYLLTDSKGLTLYTWEGDKPKESACYEACANAWPPVLVQDKFIVGAALSRVLGTTMRTDGTTQVTYKDMPLYTFRRDMAPGDTNGEGSTGFGALWVVSLLQTTPTPAAAPAPTSAPAPAAPAAPVAQAQPKPVASPSVQVPASLPRTGDGSSLQPSASVYAIAVAVIALLILGAGLVLRRSRS